MCKGCFGYNPLSRGEDRRTPQQGHNTLDAPEEAKVKQMWLAQASAVAQV